MSDERCAHNCLVCRDYFRGLITRRAWLEYCGGGRDD